jgi:Ca-activated chloride channel family protein
VIIFLTDGQPTVGETREERIVASVAPDGGAPTRIFCFGIGTDVNTHLLDKIVERTRAASQFVLPDEDLEVKVSSFFTKIKEPLLTDIKITWPEGVRVTKAYPQPLPDLFRGDQLALAGRYSGAGEGDIIIEGLVNGRPHRITQHVRFPKRTRENEFIPRLWATRRVGWLLDEIRLRGENAELRDEVAQLARQYAIVTPYTSYLILEDEARRGVPMAQRSMQTLERNREMQGILRQGYDSLAQKAGDIGTLNARASSSLKNAQSADAAVELNAFEVSAATSMAAAAKAAPAATFGGSARAPALATAAREQIASAQQNARNVAGKTFFQNGTQWLDSDVQRAKPAKTVRVQFGSGDYFKLLADQPAAAEWLALGQNVQFTLGGTLYDIFE